MEKRIPLVQRAVQEEPLHPTRLVRTVHFRARHHYARPDWPEARNVAAFGGHRRPHEHAFTLEVAVRGPVDPETGFLVDLAHLDRALRAVVEEVDGSDLDAALPEVREDGELPSTENLARWMWNRLVDRVPAPAALDRVRVSESGTLAAEYAPSPGDDEGAGG